MRRTRFSFIAIFVFGFFTWLGWGYYSKGAASEKWPVAQGTILESEVAESRKTRSGFGSRMYEAYVIYEYEVEGRKIKGDQVSLMEGSSSHRSDAAKVVNGLPVGKVVPVHYNPADPYEACGGQDPLADDGRRHTRPWPVAKSFVLWCPREATRGDSLQLSFAMLTSLM